MLLKKCVFLFYNLALTTFQDYRTCMEYIDNEICNFFVKLVTEQFADK